MSDVMLHGVLNMPLPDDPSDLDIVTWVQFRDRAREASARIEGIPALLAEARAEALREALTHIKLTGPHMVDGPEHDVGVYYGYFDAVAKIEKLLTTPAMRCAECTCENGGADCNWIKTPAPAQPSVQIDFWGHINRLMAMAVNWDNRGHSANAEFCKKVAQDLRALASETQP